MSVISVPVQTVGVDPGKRDPRILPLNVTLPRKFRGFGFESGRHHSATIQESIRGEESRTPGWSKHIRRFQVKQNLTANDINELNEFVMLARGGHNTFYVEDPFDFSSAADHRGTPHEMDQMIGWGDGSKTQYRLCKRYASTTQLPGTALNTSRYEISRNVVGITNLLIAVDGSLRNRLHPNLGYTYNPNSGFVTFKNPPTYGSVVTAGFNYLCLCRFDLGDDWLQVTHDAYEHGTVNLDVVEVKDSEAVHERMTFGGENLVVMGADSIHHLDPAAGFFQFISTSANATIYLPDIRGQAQGIGGGQGFGTTMSYGRSTFTLGGPYFCLYNLSTTKTLRLEQKVEGGVTTQYPFYRDLLAQSVRGDVPPNSARLLYVAHADARKEPLGLSAQIWVAS